MRRLLFIAAVLLSGCNPGLAQVSTMGTTAMGLPSVPAVIVTSPLYGPGPFSATTLPGTPDTTLAPVPMASDPAAPGTVVTCAAPTGLITPGTLPVPPISTFPPMVRTIGTIPAAPATNSTTAPRPFLTLSTQPATSFLSDFSGTAILAPVVVTETGNPSPPSPPGSPTTTICSSMPGGPPTNGAALPLSTPDVPASPPSGTIQQDVALLGGTSIDPAMATMPTPNTSACAESVTMNLAPPGTMAPANASGAAATPGVSPAGC